MNKSESIGKLALALSKAQSTISGAVKDSTNPYFSSKYADLESVVNAIRIPLADNELSFTQLTIKNEQGLFVNTFIMHSSGEWLEGSYPVICKNMDDPQKVGAAMTYARRFSLASAFGVPQIDDDGNTAAEKPKDEAKPKDEPKKVASDKALNNPKEQAKDKAWVAKKPTPAMITRLFAIAGSRGWSNEQVKATMMKCWNVESTKDLTLDNYEALVHCIETLSPPEIV